MGSTRVLLAIIGVAAAVLQLLLAPAITFGDATPSFISVAVVSVIVLFPDERHYVFAFVMGIVADLLAQSPVGATAFCFLACMFLLPMAFEAVGNDNLIMSIVLMFASLLAIEFAFCIFLAASGILGFLDGIVHVAFPGAVYDTILAVLVYVVCFRFTHGRHEHSKSNITMSNVRFH